MSDTPKKPAANIEIITLTAKIVIPVTFTVALVAIVTFILFPAQIGAVLWIGAGTVAASSALTLAIRYDKWRLQRRQILAEIELREAEAAGAWNQSNVILVPQSHNPFIFDTTEAPLLIDGKAEELPAATTEAEPVRLSITVADEAGQIRAVKLPTLPDGISLETFANWCQRAMVGLLSESDHVGKDKEWNPKQYRTFQATMAEAGVIAKDGTARNSPWRLTSAGRRALPHWAEIARNKQNLRLANKQTNANERL